MNETHYEKVVKQLTRMSDSKELLSDIDMLTIYSNAFKRIGEIKGKVHESLITSILAFIMSRKKVFHLKEDLCYLLYYTELSEIDAETIILPFDCFYINGFECLEFKTRDGHYVINGMYIKGMRIDADEESKRLLFEKHHKSIKPGTVENDIIFSLNLLFCSENFNDKHDESDEFSVAFPLIKGNVLEQVDYFFDNFSNNYFSEYDSNLLRNMTKFALNCILYINSDEAIIKQIPVLNKKGQKNIRKSSNKKRGSSLPYYHVGHSIVIDNKDKVIYKSELHHGLRNRLTDSWIVRGHWHGYWVNEPRKGHVVKFFDETKQKHFIKRQIKPYIKGKGDPVDKNYMVK